MFPNKTPMKRRVHLQGILHSPQKPHLSGPPVNEPSPKVPFTESLTERCTTTRAHRQSSKSLVYESPPPTCQELPMWKGTPMERRLYPEIILTYLPGSPVKEHPQGPLHRASTERDAPSPEPPSFSSQSPW